MNWRIYRLPGDREYWRVDSGEGTMVHFVRTIKSAVPFETIEIGGENVPRAWIAVAGDIYIDGESLTVAGRA